MEHVNELGNITVVYSLWNISIDYHYFNKRYLLSIRRYVQTVDRLMITDATASANADDVAMADRPRPFVSFIKIMTSIG